MKKKFKYKEHPGDLYRSASWTKIPNPKNTDELGEFWVQFLPCYQRNERVAHLDDLYKWIYNEFEGEESKKQFLEHYSSMTEQEAKNEINCIEKKLNAECYERFFHLLLDDKIEIKLSNE